MSHEIRTPMNSIIGRTNLALDSKPDQTMQSHLEMISSSSESLLALINDILDFSKIEAGELKIENRPFDLHDTVKSCMKTIDILMAEKNRELKLTYLIAPMVPQAVTGDTLRLRQILLNLLSNAVKFTEKGSIALFVDFLQSNENSLHLQFKVQDSGSGIAFDKQEHIFNKFAQEDSSTTRKYGGTGLGLSICSQLCKLMGGDINVLSAPNQGSTFIVTLPCQPCNLEDLPAKDDKVTMEQIEVRPLSLLLVEDNEPNRILARMVLEKKNHQVTEAHDGLHALTIMAKQDFDAILMDVQMPVMDGLASTRIIRAAESGIQIAGVAAELTQQLISRLSGTHTPVIAMTANAMNGDRDECLATGMNDYLSKPLQMDSLHKKLHQWTTATDSQETSLQANRNTKKDCTDIRSINTETVEKLRCEAGDIDDLLEKYLQHLPDDLSKLGCFIEEGESTKIAALAHKITSSSAIFGAEILSQLCRELEALARSGKTAGSKELLERITEESLYAQDLFSAERVQNIS